MAINVELARSVLRNVYLEHFIDDDGRPTEKCWERVDDSRMSESERVLLAIAMRLVGYSISDPPSVLDLLELDDANLQAVGRALTELVLP